MQWPLVVLVLTSALLGNGGGRHVAEASLEERLLRGVPLHNAPLYQPHRDFECLDGSQIISYEKINDDYCDCPDGSDEPGTAACPNGYFFCKNIGYRDKFISSAYVNDDVCDCCDGSDEYNSNTQCPNICAELAEKESKKAEESALVYKEGAKKYAELVEEGKQERLKNQEKLTKLKAELEEAQRNKQEAEVAKKVLEERETAALEKYKPAPEEEPKPDIEREAAAENEENAKPEGYMVEDTKENIEVFFTELDTDANGIITIQEAQAKITFDRDGNGEVTKQEALYFMGYKEELNYDDFLAHAWPVIKTFVFKKKLDGEGESQGAIPEQEGRHEEEEEFEEEAEHPVEADSEDVEYVYNEAGEKIRVDKKSEPHDGEITEEETEYERSAELDQQEKEVKEEAEHQQQIEYDEETQAIIEEAKQARERYQQAERAVLDLTSEIRKYEERADRDYGEHDVYASLDGKCIEHETAEYVYSLCLYGRATQRSKTGHPEVSLGQWNSWVGEGDNKYSAAKYDRGLTCWNGPSRSTYVTFKCGVENQLTAVSEPNRCEYAMEVATPAACDPSKAERKYEPHDEL